jgi:hypothetical protein
MKTKPSERVSAFPQYRPGATLVVLRFYRRAFQRLRYGRAIAVYLTFSPRGCRFAIRVRVRRFAQACARKLIPAGIWREWAFSEIRQFCRVNLLTKR